MELTNKIILAVINIAMLSGEIFYFDMLGPAGKLVLYISFYY